MTKRVFISYCREDKAAIKRLEEDLQRLGILTWIDRNEIAAGTRWKAAIRDAIRDGSGFLACFSSVLTNKDRSFMNSELRIAAEMLQEYPDSRAWFVPIKLDECDIPALAIGGGETLHDLQWVDLADDWDGGVARIHAVFAERFPGVINEEIYGDNEQAWKSILRRLSELQATGEVLWRHVNEDTLHDFLKAFARANSVIEEHADVFAQSEFSELNSLMEALSRYKFGKIRLHGMRKARNIRRPREWDVRDLRYQVEENHKSLKKFQTQLSTLEQEIVRVSAAYQSAA
ncbi:hypothetical protein So717_04100 [Roseobacter cerasinus]|uniref:TIR domain-containing protein n=1 Tax=Roseobacter cerasinus TaxID=2602289 RepID=A0A640VLM4_9RHOB|nr:toll/interleukin-1 receptor domain-containing protein [Roseobacter cerasinus]GFE48657.1 hypothetical protein So717_04100 [Roseobacter cerasinus]